MNAVRLICVSQEVPTNIATRLKLMQTGWVLLTLLLMSVPTIGAADTLDDRLHSFMRDHHVPGAAVAIVRDGRVADTRA